MANESTFNIDTKVTAAKAKKAGLNLGVFALVMTGAILAFNKIGWFKNNRLIAGGIVTLAGFFFHMGQNAEYVKTAGTAMFATGLMATVQGALVATKKDGVTPLLNLPENVITTLKTATQLNGGSGMGNAFENDAQREIRALLEQNSSVPQFNGVESMRENPSPTREWF